MSKITLIGNGIDASSKISYAVILVDGNVYYAQKDDMEFNELLLPLNDMDHCVHKLNAGYVKSLGYHIEHLHESWFFDILRRFVCYDAAVSISIYFDGEYHEALCEYKELERKRNAR